MSKRTPVIIAAALTAAALAGGLVALALTRGDVEPELAGARQAEQLMQGSGPPPSLPDDPQERACTEALMDSGRWSHAGAGNACALGFVVDSPEAVERCLTTTKEWATNPGEGVTPTPDEQASSEAYYAELCFLLYEGSGDLEALDTEPQATGHYGGCNVPLFDTRGSRQRGPDRVSPWGR